MPIIVDKAVVKKENDVRTIAVLYHREYDVHEMGRFGHSIGKEPYKVIKYVGNLSQEEWEYEYEGRASNRFFAEIGKLIVAGWVLIEARRNDKHYNEMEFKKENRERQRKS